MTTDAVHEFFPLTTAQRGLWMTRFIAPAGSTFNIAEAIEIPGRIDQSLFLRALYHVGLEADTLRARVVLTPAGPRQKILPAICEEFPILDLSADPEPDISAERWMFQHLRAPVDMQNDQLWKNALLKLATDRYVWFHCCHHVVLDGFSGGMIAARVADVYSAFAEGIDPGPSPFLPVKTLLEQETAYRASERHEIDRKYWLEQLADMPPPRSLSLRPHKPLSGESGGVVSRSVTLGLETGEALAALGRRFEATFPQALTALLVGYLFRMTGEADLVVGMPVSARANRTIRQTPGMVANAVALRLRISAETSFIDLMAQSRRAMRGALRHQQFRYEDLRRELGLFEIDRQISRIGINIEPFDYGLSFGGVAARNRNLSNGAMEDLTIFVFDRKDGKGVSVQCDANPALYTEAELDAHLRRIGQLAARMAQSPELPLGQHAILTPEDTRRQDARAAAAFRAWHHSDLVGLLRDSLAACAADTAVIDGSGGVTGAALWAGIATLSDALGAAGIGPGHIVAVALPRDRRMVQAVAAIAKAGAAWLPIDIDGPRGRAQLIIDDAAPALVIVPDEEVARWAAGSRCLILGEDSLPGDRYPVVGCAAYPAAQVPAGTAYVAYTSGTTGRPKGVVVPHSALVNLLLSLRERLEFGSPERVLAVTTLTFDIAVLELLLPLVAGGSVVIAAHEDIRSPRRLAALIREHAVTAMQATPTLWQTMLSGAESEALRGLKLLAGGEPLPAHVAHRLFQLGHVVYNLYGPTETTIWSTVHRLTEADLDHPPVGAPIANTRLSIIDNAGRVLPDGVVGELVVGGDGVATGYLNRPDLTAERFIADPLAPGQRAYRTGDRAAHDESGTVWLFGRSDDQIKVRGMRIEPGEVESALVGLAAVEQAAVIVEKDASTGDATLAAYFVSAAHTGTPDVTELRRLLADLLPHQMVPGRIVSVEALPRTSGGKLDRAALKALEAEPTARAMTRARTAAERMLADIWASLLNVPDVDIHANFFDLGGDSLMVLRMVTELADRGYDIPVGHIFTVPTIAALAPHFDSDAVLADPLPVMLPVRPTGTQAPIFCIHPVLGIGWSFNALAALLPRTYPIYALQNARLILSEKPPATMEALVEIYMQEIRKIQPSGPFNIVGWSMGGVIAHEIASRLRDEGEAITMLALLDSYPYNEATVAALGHTSIAVRAAMNFLHLTPGHDGLVPESLDDVADLLLDTLDLAQLPPSLGDTLTELAAKFRRVTLHNLELMQRFCPGHTDLDMLFVRAALRGGEGADILIGDRTDVWQRHTSGRIRVHDLACRHQDMFHPGHVEPLAAILIDHLERSRDGSAAYDPLEGLSLPPGRPDILAGHQA